MEGWSWALLLKPVIGLGLIAAYYFVIVKGLRWLYPRLPRNRLIDALFRERGDVAPEYGPGYAKEHDADRAVLLSDDGDGGVGSGTRGPRQLPDR